MFGIKKDNETQINSQLNQIKREISIESEKSIIQLKKNFETENIEESAVSYLLKDKNFDKAIYRLSDNNLDESMPKHCKVVESKRVIVEEFYNGHWGYWKFSPILGEVANKSGFSSVERWLDAWAKRKENFEYNKKYFLWLLKIKYPIQKTQFNS
jgi:Lhr-like helicase